MLFFTVCILSVNVIFGQSQITDFGMEQYGNTFEEPFHSTNIIRQDSIGRIIFEHGNSVFTYDGNSFIRSNNSSKGKLLLRDLQNREWYQTINDELIRTSDSDTLTINVKDYFESGMNYLYQIKDTFRMVSHKGIASFLSMDNHIEILSIDSFENFVAYECFENGDTTFIKTLTQSLYVINRDFSKLKFYGPNDLSQLHNGILYLPNNRLVYHRTNGDTLFNADSPYYKYIRSFRDKKIKATTIDKKKRIWIVSSEKNRKGVYVLEPETGKEVRVQIDSEIASHTNSIFEDHNGGIWIGTSGSGLIYIYDKAIHVFGESTGLNSNNIWSTCQAKNGNVYLSTRCQGISEMNPSNLTFSEYREDACAWALLPIENKLWIADNGIKLLEDGEVIQHLDKSNGILSRRVFSIYEDGSNNIWCGTRMAIHLVQNGKAEKYIIPSVGIYDGVFNIEEYQSGKLLLVLQSSRMFTFENEAFNEITFTDKPVTRILKDQENRIWVSTDGDGLYNFINGKFVKNKIAPESILQMQDDRQGNLWAITDDNRILFISKESLIRNDTTTAIQFLTPSHGIPLINQNYDAQPTTTLLQDGRVLFPNINGAILIDPNRIQQELPEFNFIIQKGNQSGLKYNLDYGENDIRLDIQSINLHPERSVEFQYKHNSDDWKFINTSKNVIAINNLSKGNHEILIRGRYENQKWFKPKSILINVQPLLYQKLSTQLLMIFLFACILYFMVRWRTGIIKRKNELLSRKVIEQTKVIENEKKQLAKSLNQQTQLTKELSLSQNSKNRLYAQIAHEFRSPLQAMNTYLSRSKLSLTSSDQYRITSNIKSLLNTSNEILELSKAESGKLVAKKNYYNINSIIVDQLDLMQSLIEGKNIHVKFKNRDEKTYLHIDISLFQKVIANLISNAIKFSPLNSTIKIICEQESDNQYIAIKDHGPGVPQDEIENLVLPYFQASNNKVGGTGIGLSFVESILKLHESQLEIETEIGIGSTFSFTLKRPEISQHEVLNKFVDEHDIKSQLTRIVNENKTMILVVDDNEDVLHFYKSSLSKAYNVITAINGKNALNAMNHMLPDIIISDVNMPIMGGVELLKAVRKKSILKAVPFFFVTGSTSEEMEIQSMKSGVDIILKKPIQEDYLLSRIERALNLKSDLENLVRSSFSHNLIPQDIHGDDLLLIQEMESIVLQHIDNSKLKSADIALLLGIGERTLRNRIKSISGLTIKEYLKNYRIEKAKILIEQSNRSKAEIATAVGFSSLSYFSKSYKAYFSDSNQK